VKAFLPVSKIDPLEVCDGTDPKGFIQESPPVSCPRCKRALTLNALLHPDGSPCECPHAFNCGACNLYFFHTEKSVVEVIPIRG